MTETEGAPSCRLCDQCGKRHQLALHARPYFPAGPCWLCGAPTINRTSEVYAVDELRGPRAPEAPK